MISELEFSRKLRKSLVGFKAYNFQRVEGNPGVPDLYLTKKGCAAGLWLELKVLRVGEGRIKFQPNQSRWLSGCWKDGGASAVLVAVRGDLLWLVEGSEACELEASRKLQNGPPKGCESLIELPSTGLRSIGSNLEIILEARL